MRLFLDTSSLFKLYHSEDGTESLLEFFRNEKISEISLAEISKIEFHSVVWKKYRMKEIERIHADYIIQKFSNDWGSYLFVKYNFHQTDLAISLLGKYWDLGLRTLDSIQLAALIVSKANIFSTADKVLMDIARHEGVEILKL
ncbi:type II toxin-antitoxin system VapC family toxin [Mongoliitalea lutea]|uniref:PIN domain-containing protein n=1 Tax=Mongoliitalea lutea TaxID=849756 RepID=A0A8J3CYI4_9BACT|nr:type II toxin-antitoxin system VapC family toxin [Mongoliitalea lutea]GHB37966.1 hypothetical protein GCM10008106_19000 [Mongoliitalea lutea]